MVKRIVVALIILWGFVIAAVVRDIMTMETSIPLSSLAMAGGGSVELFALFFFIALVLIWALPSTIVWFVARKFSARW
jgi:hypothetical protein